MLSICLSLALAASSFSTASLISDAKAKLTKTKLTMKVGEKKTITIKGKVAKAKYSFTSSSKKKATVTSRGVVKAKKTGKYYCLQIKKAPNSFFTLPNIKDVNGKICYALAVYRRDYDIRREKWGAQYRISNVSYFYSNVKINDNDTYTQWLSTY